MTAEIDKLITEWTTAAEIPARTTGINRLYLGTVEDSLKNRIEALVKVVRAGLQELPAPSLSNLARKPRSALLKLFTLDLQLYVHASTLVAVVRVLDEFRAGAVDTINYAD